MKQVLNFTDWAKQKGELSEKVNPAYLTKDAATMRSEIKKNAKKKDSDSTAYTSHPDGGWKADYSKSGKRYKTKPSKYTLAYRKKFESYVVPLALFENETALKNKAKSSGIPLGILRTVYKKGMAAWKTGHRPGVAQQQWAMARVNSFIVGGKTTKKADKSLWQRAKKAKHK